MSPAGHPPAVTATATTSQHADTWLQRLGRFGLVARGLNYLVVGWLAILVAKGDTGQRTDRQGALAAIARQPLGRWLLVLLVLGFAGYAAWRVAEAATGSTSSDDDAGWGKRLGSLAKAALYVGIAASTAALARRGDRTGGGGEQQQQTWTARVLGWPMGRTLVIVAGLIVVAAGAVNLWRGATQRFMKQLKRYQLDDAEPLVRAVGTVGHVGRGIAFGLVGTFLVRAAIDHDPERARGLDGALHELVARTYGPPMLVGVAVGLLAFGVYSLFEARWRRVLR